MTLLRLRTPALFPVSSGGGDFSGARHLAALASLLCKPEQRGGKQRAHLRGLGERCDRALAVVLAAAGALAQVALGREALGAALVQRRVVLALDHAGRLHAHSVRSKAGKVRDLRADMPVVLHAGEPHRLSVQVREVSKASHEQRLTQADWVVKRGRR